MISLIRCFLFVFSDFIIQIIRKLKPIIRFFISLHKKNSESKLSLSFINQLTYCLKSLWYLGLALPLLLGSSEGAHSLLEPIRLQCIEDYLQCVQESLIQAKVKILLLNSKLKEAGLELHYIFQPMQELSHFEKGNRNA